MPDIKRVLFILPERPHYGLDVLYDGLCNVLGDENVEDYPYKPSLHGWRGGRFENYPCFFHRSETFSGFVPDVCLVGTDYTYEFEDLPWVFVDQEDEFSKTPEGAVLSFHRECRIPKGYTLVDGCHSLPFSYPESLAVKEWHWHTRTIPVFWAGYPGVGDRLAYLTRLVKRGVNCHGTFHQGEYRGMLKQARIGLSLFGAGQDTARYWEIPAMGAMLFAQRPTIVIPHNFVDGESAVFFDTPDECMTKLDHYLARPEEVEQIAEAGHAHFLKYHTNTKRAEQLLATVKDALFANA